jgi:UDP-N-acetylmuramate-alanine ligase
MAYKNKNPLESSASQLHYINPIYDIIKNIAKTHTKIYEKYQKIKSDFL